MKYYLPIFALLTVFCVQAQEFRGIAEYESKKVFTVTSLDANGVEIKDDPFIEQMKKAYEKKYILYFDKTASVYVEQPKMNQPTNGNTQPMADLSGGSKHYKNLKEKVAMEEIDFFGKDFLQVDSLAKYDWKLVNETKKIGNYTCYKATHTIPRKAKDPREEPKAVNILGDKEEKDIVIIAWYAPEIPVSHGPEDYWGLPGLILEVSGGSSILLCSKITLNPKEKYEIKAPTKGKKVSSAELEEIAIQKMKEMNEINSRRTAPKQ